MTPRGDSGCIVQGVILGRTLKAFGILIVGLVAGAILWSTGHWVIGLILVCAAIPVAFTAWIVADD